MTNENGNTTYWNLWDAGKTVLRRKLKLHEETKISNNLTWHHKELEKKEHAKPRVSRRKETTKIRAKINEIETEKTIGKINETKS